MQFLPPVTDDPAVISREASAGLHLPYLRHIDDNTIETRDGRLIQCMRVHGMMFETADATEIDYRLELRDAMLRALGSSRYALWHHVVRRRVDVGLNGSFGDSFSRSLDAQWQSRLTGRSLFTNDLFLTVVRRPTQGRVGWLDRVRGWIHRKADDDAAMAVEVAHLNNAMDALVAALGFYGVERLTVYERDGALYSEPLEFLSCLFGGVMRPVRVPNDDIGHYLPDRRISFGHKLIEFDAAAGQPSQFAGMLSIKDYPGVSSAGMLDELLRLPVEFTLSQSFAFVERGDALSRMNFALRRMRAAEDEALSLRDELSAAKDDAAAGRAHFGEHHTTLLVRGPSVESVEAGLAEGSAVFTDLGIIAAREDIALEPVFWAQFPGNFPYIARRALISTRNFAGLASLHNFPSGRRDAQHWEAPVTVLETSAAGPYFFNFHDGDLGNFTLIGPSGSGKTVILNFLLAQARRFDPRIVFFDKDRGADIFIRALGGAYHTLRPGEGSGLNPLLLPDTPENRQFLVDWLSLLAGMTDEAEQALLHDAVAANYTQPADVRRLRHLVSLLRGSTRPHSTDLYARMRPWWGDGEHAWLFDNAEDRCDLDQATVGFDMTAVLDAPTLRTPTMLYLFHRVEERLDGHPTIIVVDEGWKALDDPVFVRRIKDWEKTIRKRNGLVGFATQSAQDALESHIASAIIEQAATQIFTVNPKARDEDYVDGFGLTEHEFELVRSLPAHARLFLIKHGNHSVIARLDLSRDPDIITVLSGREETVRRLDKIRAQVGDDPEAWMPPLLAGAA